MSDDIETLRILVRAYVPPKSDDFGEALAALARMEEERREYDGAILYFEVITKSFKAAEAERNALRAKLERAKEALEPFANVYRSDLRRARAVLAELSADASAQPTYDPRFDGDPSTWPLHNPAIPRPIEPPSKEWCERMAQLEGDHEIGAGALAIDPGPLNDAPAQQTQISDEAAQ